MSPPAQSEPSTRRADAVGAARLAVPSGFLQFMESSPDSMVLLDRDGTIVVVNHQSEQLFGYSRSELVGRPGEVLFQDRGPESYRDRVARLFEETRPGTEGPRFELTGVRKDGSLLPAEVSLGRLETDLDAFLTAAIRDITDRKNVDADLRSHARELRTLNEELESFAYSVSHDLRAPLRHIQGFSDVLREDYSAALDEDGRRHLERIQAACGQMAELIDALLTLSRVSRGEVRRESVDLAALARQVFAELAGPAANVELVVEPSLPVRGDPGLLRVLLENLLSNAIKFSRGQPRARVEVGSRPTDEGPAYFVRDNGVGFNMDNAGSLFRPFQRLHKKEEFEGTGVGLTTVHRVVNRHGGRVWVEAKLGQGAAFHFTLGQGPGDE